MPELDQLYQALDRADTAKDTAAVRDLTTMIREQEKQSAQRPAVEPGLTGVQEAIGLPADSPAPAKGAWQTAKDLAGKAFTRTEAQPTTMPAVAGELAAGGVGGAAMNVALPGALQAGGKALQHAPNAILKGIGYGAEKLGDVLKMIPAGERAVRGFGGGTAAAAADVAGKALGMSPAETFGANVLLGGVGEATSSLLFKEGGKIFKAATQAAGGDANAAINTVKGMVKPYKELNEASARRLQKVYFGDPIPGYEDKLITSDARSKLQETLRAEDPWLESAFSGKSVMGQAKKVPGTGGTYQESMSRDVATQAPQAFGQPGLPQLGGAKALPGPTGATAVGAPVANGMPGKPGSATASGNSDMAARMKARGEAQIAAGQEAPKNASELYRNRMFAAVTDAVGKGQRFSDTPGAQQFFGKLRTLVGTGELSQGEAQSLIKQLSTDRSPDAAVRGRFAKNLDNQIRDFGKPMEGAAKTGAKAIPADLSKEVRGDLQKAQNAYLESIGQGKLEQRYRETATREYTAAAQDHVRHFLSGKGTPTEFKASARDMMRDPASAQFLQGSLKQHLAQAEPTQIGKEFGRVRDALVDAKLMTYEEAGSFRKKVEDVARVADTGARLGYQQRLQSMLLNAVTRKMVGEAGGAAGQALAGGQ